MFVPARIVTTEVELVLSHGESAWVDQGQTRVFVEAPGFQLHDRSVVIPDQESFTLVLKPQDLIPEIAFINTERTPATVAVDLAPWSEPCRGPGGTAELVLATLDQGFEISRQVGDLLPIRVDIATRVTPRRRLAVPPLGTSDTYLINWRQRRAHVQRPWVEPTDPGGRLLIAYLLTGRNELAAAAARLVERLRGTSSPIDWAAASYTQLLIGYAYALGRDHTRLGRWCRRTCAAATLGADGLVLEAEAAWQLGDAEKALTLLASTEKLSPPTLTYGAEIGLRLAALLAAHSGRKGSPASQAVDAAVRAPQQDGESSPLASQGERQQAVVRMANRWLPLLTRADADAPNLSVPETRTIKPDLSNSSWYQRMGWLAQYIISRWRYDYVLSTHTTAKVTHTVKEKYMAEEKSSTSRLKSSGRISLQAQAVLLILLGLAVLIGLSVAFLKNDTGTWIVLGSVQALTFAAAGAFFGVAVYRERAIEAERRARGAEDLATQYREDATRGRALAAVLQAEATQGPTATAVAEPLVRYKQISRNLFGDLVAPRTDAMSTKSDT
jgi:hypothetical protein